MEYEIVYSKRRTLCLQIKADSSIIVRAPYRVSKTKIDEFVSQHLSWIEKKLGEIRLRPAPKEFSQIEVEKLKQRAKELIFPLVQQYSLVMGVFPKHVSINSAKKRYGSCSSKGNLNFSFRLALYPKEALEYVVVHELAHMTEMNHSKKFWAIVEKILPDYKERKRLLG